MASIKNVIFGFPVGKAGDIIFKVRGGKPYFSLKPIQFKRKDEEQFRKIKEDFAFAARLSSAIYRVNIFRTEWENFNKIMKTNYKILKESGALDDLKLVPSVETLNLSVISLQLNADEIEIEAAINYRQNQYGTMISLQGILYLSDPEDEYLEKYFFLPCTSKDYDYNSTVVLKIILTPQESEIIKRYKTGCILLNAAVKELRSGNVEFSNNIQVTDILQQ